MIGEADHRSVTSAVRPPRLAIFFDRENLHWRTIVISLIRHYSATWGGEYFLIVPTDGKTIKEEYWTLLEAHSPDYLGTYQMMLGDLRHADPASFAAWVKPRREAWKFEFDFEEWLKEQERLVQVVPFSLENGLEQELKHRLSPVHQPEIIIRERLSYGVGLDFPFTPIADINPNASQPAERIVLARDLHDPDIQALVLSQWGDLDQDIIDRLSGQGVIIDALTDDFSAEDQAELALRSQLLSQASWTTADSAVRSYRPFAASMLHLTRYYRVETHHDEQEPITIFVGDSVDDFCMYFCMSRLHDGALWLPQRWLNEYEKRRANNLRLRRRGRPIRPYSAQAKIAMKVVVLLQRAIRPNRPGKQIMVRSMSLTSDELNRLVRIMGRASYVPMSEFRRYAKVDTTNEFSVNCIARVIEENNYVSQQDMVFIEGRSVGHFCTPATTTGQPVRLLPNRLICVDLWV
jgi:hypothetical protein